MFLIVYKWLGKCPVTIYNIDILGMPILKNVNKDFFKKWTPEMAYVLGLFAADGYITVNKRGGQFWCLDIVDKKLIKKIRDKIDSNHKISTRKRNSGEYTTYRLQIGSIEMCEDLRFLGFYERKTKNLSIPNIPPKYFPDFVRGYFDGDGNVWVGYVHKGRVTRTLSIQTVFTSCSKEFLEELKMRLEINGVNKGRIRQGKGNYFRLVYSIINSFNLYNFMYNDKSAKNKLYLARKKIIFDKYIKNKYMRS